MAAMVVYLQNLVGRLRERQDGQRRHYEHGDVTLRCQDAYGNGDGNESEHQRQRRDSTPAMPRIRHGGDVRKPCSKTSDEARIIRNTISAQLGKPTGRTTDWVREAAGAFHRRP